MEEMQLYFLRADIDAYFKLDPADQQFMRRQFRIGKTVALTIDQVKDIEGAATTFIPVGDRKDSMPVGALDIRYEVYISHFNKL